MSSDHASALPDEVRADLSEITDYIADLWDDEVAAGMDQVGGTAAGTSGPDRWGGGVSARRAFLSIDDLRDECLDGAACLYDPELHDGPVDMIEAPDERAVREHVAAEVCASCPVLPGCLTYTLRVRPRRGVWAGLPAEGLAALADLAGVEEVA